MAGFVDWLNAQLNERGWKSSELARRSDIDSGYLSRILSGERNPGIDTYSQIAQALDLKLETVLQAAGYLPDGATTDDDLRAERAGQIMRQLTPRGQEEALEYLELKLRQDEADEWRRMFFAADPAERDLVIAEFLIRKGYVKK